jgi:hypothetical protein
MSWSPKSCGCAPAFVNTATQVDKLYGQALCWHHPQLWGLLPEPIPRHIAVPEWPVFLRGCLKYREALDRELPDAPRSNAEYRDRGER